jgi:hypothetical protein
MRCKRRQVAAARIEQARCAEQRGNKRVASALRFPLTPSSPQSAGPVTTSGRRHQSLPHPQGRIGGQAEVMVFTGDNPLMNMLGAVYTRLKSWLSYLY